MQHHEIDPEIYEWSKLQQKQKPLKPSHDQIGKKQNIRKELKKTSKLIEYFRLK